MDTTAALDSADLTGWVEDMYQEVALHPGREFHFETGRPLAEHLGYPPADLDRILSDRADNATGKSGAPGISPLAGRSEEGSK